jgi:carbon monoxide dehydrogenase subunit G
MFETEHATSVRIKAPVDAVWREVGSLRAVLDHAPGLEGITVDPSGDSARFRVKLGRGLLEWDLEGTVAPKESIAPERRIWQASIPQYNIDLEGTIELARRSNDETELCFKARLDCRHPVAARLHTLLVDAVEEHVESVAAGVATAAVQHTNAERQLRFRAPPH